MRTNLPHDFSENAYLRLNPDVEKALKSGQLPSASQHYIDFGANEGRAYSNSSYEKALKKLSEGLPPDFSEKMYLDLHADVAKAVEAGDLHSAASHYIAFGKKEGRIYNLNFEETKSSFSAIGRKEFRYPYRSIGEMPSFEFGSRSRGSNDLQICERIISAWHLSASSDPGGVDGMWQQLTSGNNRLANALSRRDPEALAEILANMFQEHIVHGLAMGRTVALVARHFPERFSASWCDVLLRLGEAIGVSPVRSPEQGGVDGPLEFIDVVPEIEKRLGFQLKFPPVGAAYGVSLHGTPFPGHALNHAYVAWRINSLREFDNVAEIGGGYGGLCHLMNKDSRSYTIYDLPYTNIIQSYFLMKSGLPVSLNGEKPARIKVLPWWQINERNVSYDLVINQDSIPEMPLKAGQGYIKRIKEISPYFYSVNQEARALNTAAMHQLCVPDLIRAEGGYKLLSRNLFWLRDGYVEEIYERAQYY